MTTNAQVNRLRLTTALEMAQGHWAAAHEAIAKAVQAARDRSARNHLWRLLARQALIEDQLGLGDGGGQPGRG